MHKNKNNFIVLASIMIALTLTVSVIQSFMLYQTFLTEQRFRLHDLVVSQASLASELFSHYENEMKKNGNIHNFEAVLSHLAKAQNTFGVESKSSEFTMAVKSNNNIHFLVVDGRKVTDDNSLNKIEFGHPEALPMQMALNGESGTIIGLDYRGEKVLAAFTSVPNLSSKVGMVAKINLNEIQRPFLIVNIEVFAVGLLLILIAITLLYLFSDPFFKKHEKSEREYRELVENANSIILRINDEGLISFANDFAVNVFKSDYLELIGLPFLNLLAGDIKSQDIGSSIQNIISFFSNDIGPHERPCIKADGTIIWFAWRVKINRNIEGEPVSLLCIGNDITANYNMIEKLKESEERHRNIFENAPLAMVHFNKEGAISDCNETFLDLMGAPRNQVIGFNTYQKSYPAMRKALNEAINGQFSFYEDTYTSITGLKKIYLRAFFNPVKQDDPPYEVIATLEDISQRKQIEMELAESERRFKGLAKASPVGIIITDIHGNLLYANKRMIQICEASYKELEFEGWISRLHPDDKVEIENMWYKIVPVAASRAEFRIIRGNGLTRWVLGQIVELEGDNEMTGYVITVTDITNVKEAEFEHRRLSTAIHQAAEVIIITDTTGKIEYVNPAFERVTGYNASEVIGKNPNILKSGEHDDTFYADMWETILQGEAWSGRFINLRKDGARYTQEATIAPVRNEQGQIISFVGVAKDISKQLVVEAQLRQAQKLESIGELAAGIAHEINTPTQYVNTNINFLGDSNLEIIESLEHIKQLRKLVKMNTSIDEIGAELDKIISDEKISYLAEDISNAIKESEEGLNRISEIVKSVRQLAHPGETQKGYYNLNEIINDAVTVSANEWKYIAEINLYLSEELPEIRCLKGEMGQVLLNLIINSAHAIEMKKKQDKGRIDITTYAENDSVFMDISDNGCGMSKTVIARAFDPFFTTKEVGKGTGQGLAIAHNVIVVIHKGSIVIDSIEGKGTTMTVTLPASKV